MSSPPRSYPPGLAAVAARAGRWFPGLTWRTVGTVAIVNAAITAALVLVFENKFFDLLISVEIVGFSVMLAIYAAAEWRVRKVPRAVLLGLAIVLASVAGTVLVALVKGRDLTQIFVVKERLWGFVLTTSMGVGIGTIGAIIFSARAQRAEFTAELHRAEAERQRLARQMAEAELKLMQAQVEPHFLYNTLANVHTLIECDPPAASRMLDHLIRYLRAALPRMREPLSTLGREIELAAAYLAILQMRMGERLSFEMAIPDGLRGLPVPPMMLMTLVENAIKHGIETRREGGTVTIGAERADGRLRVTVTDTGQGFPPQGANRQGVGLANIRERLRTLYGQSAQLHLEARQPHGVVASIEIPLEAPDGHPR